MDRRVLKLEEKSNFLQQNPYRIAGLDKLLDRMQFGPKEKQVLRLFYNEKLKVRQDDVPEFYFFAKLCEGSTLDVWPFIIHDVKAALINLRSRDFIEVRNTKAQTASLSMYVGESSTVYRLTVRGNDELHKWKPPIGLLFRSWIAVAPPWFVLINTIAGGIGGLWKTIDVVHKYVIPFVQHHHHIWPF